MDPNITIVTAFFDIGRSNWPTNPPYLRRSTDHYFQNFERLLKLENQIIVHTSRDLEEKFRHYQHSHPNLTVIGWENWVGDIWPEFFQPIERIQEQLRTWVQQPWNPEYWSPEYVIVNMLKSYFVNYSIESNLVKTDLIAWIDFGYARQDEHVPTNIWNYDFDSSKVHFFSIKSNCPPHMDLTSIINSNDVWITGCHIVAGKERWKDLLVLVYHSIKILLTNNLIDDDQTVLYMAYCQKPELFSIHYIDPDDWFCIFRKFNIPGI